jgi:HTH-type transcriptional regulator / antitoxin HigA
MIRGNGKMTAPNTAIDQRKYAKLLAKALPAVIETEEQNERMLREVERLIDKGEDKLSPEEKALFKLMVTLIEDFEEQHYQLNAATPVTILKELMVARGLQPKDLWEVFGSKSLTSEILNGNRAISKSKAKALADFFRVSAELFI